jgi:Putative prokaryotic signal transducing protein
VTLRALRGYEFRPLDPAKLASFDRPQYSDLVSDRDESNLGESVGDSKERARLASLYARMTDGELQNLASNPQALTDAAWEALEDEFDHRHLKLPEPPPSIEQLDLQSLVTIRQFRDLPEALLAKGSLESAGIECFLRDDNMVRLDWFISNFIGGIKLCVRPEDAHNAQKLLDEPILEGLYVQGVGLYEQPRCPKCQSLDVTFRELDRPIAYLSAFLRVPMPVQRKAWRCRSCDAEWEQEDRELGDAEEQ